MLRFHNNFSPSPTAAPQYGRRKASNESRSEYLDMGSNGGYMPRWAS